MSSLYAYQIAKDYTHKDLSGIDEYFIISALVKKWNSNLKFYVREWER